MTLDNLISHSYGIEDYIFAGHEYDRKRALEALTIANEEGVGFTEFMTRHRQYLQGRGCSEEHIVEQLERVKRIDLYFSND
jgi:hypothetical protein